MNKASLQEEKIDVLVIGAGPSGTVAASILNNEGFNVKIVEKQKFPRFVIGESLLPRCMDNLQRADLLEAIKEDGFQEKFGATFIRNEEVCDFNFSEQFTKGWSWTWQVSRADFDHTLAKAVEKKGVEIDYETEVISVEFKNDKTSLTKVKEENGDERIIAAKYVIDASGYGRVLPNLLDLNEKSDLPVRASFFCHLKEENRPDNVESNRITIIIHAQEVWIWIIPLANNITSVGVVGDPDIINQYNGNVSVQFDQWMLKIPMLKERFAGKGKLFEPKKIQGYSAAVKQLYGDGYVLTGNSTEFLDPVFSSGVTFATESGALAANLIARELKGEPVDWEKEYSDYIKQGVDVFRTFVTAWYDGSLQKIFFAHNANQEIKKQICSVLAGYVWDTKNPFVKKHARAVKALAQVV